MYVYGLMFREGLSKVARKSPTRSQGLLAHLSEIYESDVLKL